MAKTMADLEKDELQSRGKQKKTSPSLSNYKEPELMPMREKEILSKKDQKAKQLIINSAGSNEIPLEMGFLKLFNYGKTINPSVPAEKKDNTAEATKNMLSSDIATSAKGFSDLKGDAPQQELPKQDTKQLMEDARAQRKASFWDALNALGTGMQGRSYDWQNSRTNQLQTKRDAEFKEYKDIVKNNQVVKSAWESKKNDDVINYIQKLKEEAKNEPARLKQLELYEQQLKNSKQQYDLNKVESDLRVKEYEARKAGGYYDYADRKSSAGSGSHYERITLPTTQERIINDVITLGSGDKASAAYSNRIRESIIRSLYDETTDASGVTKFTLKPGAEAKIKSLAEKTKELGAMKTRLDILEKSLENSLNPSPAEQKELSDLKAKVPALQDELFQLIDDTTVRNTSIDDIIDKSN